MCVCASVCMRTCVHACVCVCVCVYLDREDLHISDVSTQFHHILHSTYRTLYVSVYEVRPEKGDTGGSTQWVNSMGICRKREERGISVSNTRNEQMYIT